MVHKKVEQPRTKTPPASKETPAALTPQELANVIGGCSPKPKALDSDDGFSNTTGE